MAINFPDSPSVNDTHTVGDKTWTWDGTVWSVVTGGIPTSISELTITNDLTVDTDTLHVDSTNDRVGIGTSSPDMKVHIVQDGGNLSSGDVSAETKGTIHLQNSGGTKGDGELSTGVSFSGTDTGRRRALIAAFQDGTDGDPHGLQFFTYGSTASASDAVTSRMTIDSSGNVGIGTTSPTGTVDINGNTSTLVFTSPSNTNRYRIDANMTDAADYGLSIGYWDGSAYQRTITVDDGGNVGIGTTSPASPLHVEGNIRTSSNSYINNGSGEGLYIDGSNNKVQLNTTGTSHLTINSSGNVGIGTTSPASTAPYENYKLTLTDGGFYTYETMNMINGYARVTADAALDDTPGLLLNNTGANTTNHSTPGLWFTSTDSAFTTASPKYLAGIVGRASETYNSDTKGGMYIQMYMQGNSPGASDILSGTSYGYTFGQTSFSMFTSNTVQLGNSARLWTQLFAATTTISTSDLRDKTDVVDLDYGLDFVNSLRPVTYRYAFRDSDNEGVRTHMGFIAQEVEQVLGDDASSRGVWTSSEFETTDELDEDGNPVPLDIDRQGLRYEELIAPMVKAIQELSARIEALEAN